MDMLNAYPENDRARRFLEKIDIAPNPTRLAIVEIAQWALASKCGRVEEATTETVQAMAEWSPVRLANFFLCYDQGRMLSPGWEDIDNANDFGTFVLEDIEKKVLDHFPCYFLSD